MRWTTRAKEKLLKQIDQGLISAEEAGISHEELASWQQLYVKWGHKGLRTTLTQSYLPKSQRTLQ